MSGSGMTNSEPMRETAPVRRLAAAALFLVSYALYAVCLSPGIGWGDGPDFVLSAKNLGVAHPTGYPLLTLAAKLFTALPVNETAYTLSVMSAVAGAAAVAVFALLCVNMSGALLAGIATACVVAVSSFVWGQSVIIEVYSLNVLFCVLAVWWSVANGQRGARALMMLTLVFCVGLGNHATLVFPAVVLGVAGLAAIRRKLAGLAGAVFVVGLGITLYGCLPLMSARTDIFDWNTPVTAKSLYLLMTGLDFWVIGEYRLDVMAANAMAIGSALLKQAGVPVAAFAALVWMAPRETKRRGMALAAAALVAGAFPIIYPTMEKQAFFLMAFVLLCLGGGLMAGASAAERRGWITAVYVPLCVVLCALNIAANRSLFDNASDDTARVYGEALMKTARRDAVIFVDHVADDTVAAPLYLQCDRGVRRDVLIFHRLYLAFPWWREYMEQRARASGFYLVTPVIDIAREKAADYRISKEENERLREGKTMNTVAIDIQTIKYIEANADVTNLYINTPYRFRKTMLSADYTIARDGCFFALDNKRAYNDYDRSGMECPPPMGRRLYDDVMFNAVTEGAYSRQTEGAVCEYAALLEKSLDYDRRDWVYGELAGALKYCGEPLKAQKYKMLYDRSRSKKYGDALNDIY